MAKAVATGESTPVAAAELFASEQYIGGFRRIVILLLTLVIGPTALLLAVGILMLDARFPRIPGDMGNATTWPFPVHYKIVRSATPDRVVRGGAEGLLDVFVAAARELVDDGVDGITTNCGFLSLFQEER